VKKKMAKKTKGTKGALLIAAGILLFLIAMNAGTTGRSSSLYYDGVNNRFQVEIERASDLSPDIADDFWVDALVTNPDIHNAHMYVQCSILDKYENKWIDELLQAAVPAGRTLFRAEAVSNCEDEYYTQTKRISLGPGDAERIRFNFDVPRKGIDDIIFCSAFERCSNGGIVDSFTPQGGSDSKKVYIDEGGDDSEYDDCDDDGDCDRDEVCVTANNWDRCVADDDWCTRDSHCTSDDCREGRCYDGRRVECVRNADCRSSEVCTDCETCIDEDEYCDDDDDCHSDEVCDDCECVDEDDANGDECDRDSDCRSDEVCDRGECVDECDDDDDCRSGEDCRRGVCVDDDEECDDDSDCDCFEECVRDECVEKEECERDSDCRRGQDCNNDNECVPECDDDDDCDNDEFCTTQGVCVDEDDECKRDSDCDEDEDCWRQECRDEDHLECSLDSECAWDEECTKDGVCERLDCDDDDRDDDDRDWRRSDEECKVFMNCEGWLTSLFSDEEVECRSGRCRYSHEKIDELCFTDECAEDWASEHKALLFGLALLLVILGMIVVYQEPKIRMRGY
jgi:hypothetical protein